MKTILVLSPHPDFAESIRAGLSPELYRVVHRLNVDEAEPLLMHGLAGVCIVDVDLMGVEAVWVIERLRRRDAKCPIIAYTANNQSEWEEEAFLLGVTHILTKPVRERLLNSLLERLATPPPITSVSRMSNAPASTHQFTNFRAAIEPVSTSRFANASQTIDVLRDFSSILTHSLDAEAMLKQFLIFLREVLSINRAQDSWNSLYAVLSGKAND
jgi:CheY-like chemotaxis protein